MSQKMVCVEDTPKSLVSCDNFGGKWDSLIDGEYVDSSDYAAGNKASVLSKVIEGDITKLAEKINSKAYSKYCYTQEAVDPKNDKLNTSRLCETVGVKFLLGSPEQLVGATCIMKDKLPGDPDVPNYLYDIVDLGTSVYISAAVGEVPSIYKERMSANNSSGYEFGVVGVNQKFRFTIKGKK